MNANIQIRSNESLDPAVREEMWRLYAPHHNTARDEFIARSETSLDTTALFRDEAGALVGFTGLRRLRAAFGEGKTALTLYVGQTFILPAYRGSNLIQRTVVKIWTGAQLRRVHEPVFLWSDCIGYKPYLLAARNLKTFYPSVHWDTPPDVRALIDLLGRRYYGDAYDPRRGTVAKSDRRLRGEAASIPPELLADADVRFYAERNANHARGDGMILLTPATLPNLGFFLARQARKAMRRERSSVRARVAARASSQSLRAAAPWRPSQALRISS